jgi:hypothetical protein
MRPELGAHLVAACRGAGAGVAAGLVFGVAHGVFLVWAVAPFLLGAVMGGTVGAACGVGLHRAARRASPLGLGALLAATGLPLGLSAFVLMPVVGSPPWLVWGTLLACIAVGAMAGVALGAKGWGVAAFAAVGLAVGGPGQPFIHEGPKPYIVGFYAGLVLALAVAGATAAILVAPRAVEERAPA